MFRCSPNLLTPVELGNVTLTISREQCGPLLSSARELTSVKKDAIVYSERVVQAGGASRSRLQRDRAELANVEDLADKLERVGRGAHDQQLTVGRALIDEIVVSALASESQALADTALRLSGAGDLGQIAARLEIVGSLFATLANLRS
jgi:vacuolar-type H+-ATPase subunit I/STV1